MQKNQTKKAALYIRVSTHYQIDKDSLPFQRNELINYAKYALGIDDYAIFEDAGYSGKNTDRPAYQDMMRRIRAKEFSHLCVWKIDRISRNLLDFAAMYDELKKFNCTFVSKNEQFDTSSAIGEAMLRIILVFAELERKLTAERVTSIMYSRANKGLWNGAPIPLGYKWDAKGKYPVIDEDTAVVVRYIYDQYEKIHSTMKLSDKLNRENIKSARGGEWTGTTVKGILRNPFYKGTYRYKLQNADRAHQTRGGADHTRGQPPRHHRQGAMGPREQNSRRKFHTFRRTASLEREVYAHFLQAAAVRPVRPHDGRRP